MGSSSWNRPGVPVADISYSNYLLYSYHMIKLQSHWNEKTQKSNTMRYGNIESSLGIVFKNPKGYARLVNTQHWGIERT